MSILHTAKWCQDRQEYSTHAGHDHSNNISSLKELRNNVGKITSHLHIMASWLFLSFILFLPQILTTKSLLLPFAS